MLILALVTAVFAALGVIGQILTLHRLMTGDAFYCDLVGFTGRAGRPRIAALPGVFEDASGVMRFDATHLPALLAATGHHAAFAFSRETLSLILALTVASGQGVLLPGLWLAVACAFQVGAWLDLEPFDREAGMDRLAS
ncbi:hypothetical protein [Marinivivus vitaminiproducens]|uniref:hypothetical protein n=1 Tax=Marinivivus vitaminiproducens TaxID=3035935 RepID=UPI0027A71AB2|nr:hypothetical protein P4R82_22460 [Geminicoccaceae bacterium SCSIO 64248]